MNTENIPSNQSKVQDETFWKNHYEQLKLTGMSRTKYCHINHLNYDRFGYWINKWSISNASFVAVKIKDQKNDTPSVLCTMTLKNGSQIKIHDLSVLSFVLERLT